MSFAGGSRSESGLRPAHINPIPEWTTATFEVASSKSCPPGASTSAYYPYPTTPTYHEAVQRSKSTRRPLRSSPLAGPALISSSSEAVPADSSPQRRTSFTSGISLKPSSLIPRPLSALLRSKSSQSLPRSTSKAPFDDSCAASSSSSSSTPSALPTGLDTSTSLPRPTGRYSVRPSISPLQPPSPRVVGPRPPSGSMSTDIVNDSRRLPRARSAIAVRPIPAMPSPSALTEVQMQTEETHPRSRTVQISDQTLIHSRRLSYPHAHNSGQEGQVQVQLRQGERTTMDARLRSDVGDVRSRSAALEKSASSAYPSPPASPRLLRADSSSSFSSSSSSSYGSPTPNTRPNSLTRPAPAHARSPPTSPGTHPRPLQTTTTTTRPTSSSTNAPPRDTWYTHHAYAITPRFSRLGLSAPGVVLPIPAKEFRRRSAAAALGGQSKRGGGGGGGRDRGSGMMGGMGGGGMRAGQASGSGTIGSIPEGKPAEGERDGTLDSTDAVASTQKTPSEVGDAVRPPSPSSVSSASMRSTPTPHGHVARDSNSNSLLPTPPHTPLSLTNANDSAVSAATADTGEHVATTASDAADPMTNVHANSMPTPPTSPAWLKFPPQMHQIHIPTSPYDPPTPTPNNHTQYTHPMRTRSNTASSTSTTSTLFLSRSHASEFHGTSPSTSNFGSNAALSVASTVTSLDLSSAVSVSMEAQSGVVKKPSGLGRGDAAETHSLRSLRPTRMRDTDTETDGRGVLEVKAGPALGKRKSMLARVKSWRWTSPPPLTSTDPPLTPIPTSPPTSKPPTPQIPSTTSALPPTQSDTEPERQPASSPSNSDSDSETPTVGQGVGSGGWPGALASQASSASEPSLTSAHQSSERAEPEVAGGCREEEERDCNVNPSTSLVGGLEKESADIKTDDNLVRSGDANPTSVNPPTLARVPSAQPSLSLSSLSQTKTKDAQALVEVRYLDVEISEPGPGPKRVRYKQSGSLRRAWRSLRGGA